MLQFLFFVITPVVLAYYFGLGLERLLCGRRGGHGTKHCLTCSRGVAGIPDDTEVYLVDDACELDVARTERPDHLAEFLVADFREPPALPERTPGAVV